MVCRKKAHQSELVRIGITPQGQPCEVGTDYSGRSAYCCRTIQCGGTVPCRSAERVIRRKVEEKAWMAFANELICKLKNERTV